MDAQAIEAPAWLRPLGPTAGWPFNGAMSNLAFGPGVGRALRDGLRAFDPDVVHLHEPVAPLPCWQALAFQDAPLVGTFHTYGTSRQTHGFAALCGSQARMRRLAIRIAVSEAAAWTGRSFYGGEYRVIPNGIHLQPAGSGAPAGRGAPAWPGATEGHAAAARRGAAGGRRPLRIVFVGRSEARKGLPVLLRAFEALRREVPSTLELVGVEAAATETEKAAALARADVLVAPSLGGESFGMVLLEAFAAGLPVVCSDIPGYRAVARHDVEALHVTPGDPAALGEALRDLALDRPRLARLAQAAAARAESFAWPTVAAAVESAYEDAATAPVARSSVTDLKAGLCRSSDPFPPLDASRDSARRASRRLPAPLAPLEPAAPRREGLGRGLRAGATVAGVVAVLAGAGVALHRIGADELAGAVARSSPGWTVLAFAVMAVSLVLRAGAWRALLVVALPDARPRLRDTFQATAIGVLMSATLPARLGEPARVLVLARRLGRPREHVPGIVGTLVAQTALNLLALALLAAVVLGGPGPWRGDGVATLAGTAIPLALLVAVVLAAPPLAARLTRTGRPPARGERRRAATVRLRQGLTALADPRHAPVAITAQLAAWALQWLGCWLVLAALGLDDPHAPVAAAGVLLAVNVTAIVPLTPSNVGVFQAACVAVLAAYGTPAADALAYGLVLQAIELAVAVALGAPALVREGLGWRDVRARALLQAPVSLSPRAPASAGARPAG